jgi:hypothetical protein
MTYEQAMEDTHVAVDALQQCIGKKVESYRAPAFSITHQNKWAVNVLADCGIESDASIFPTSRDFGGYKAFPQDTPCIIRHEGATLKEYPISLTSILGKNMAYSGGGFFRLLPYWLVSKTIKLRDYNICYFHLNDLIHHRFEFKSKAEYEENFKEPGTLKNRIVRYVKMNIGKGNAYGKLQRLLTEHEFVSVGEADRLIDWGKVNVVNL